MITPTKRTIDLDGYKLTLTFPVFGDQTRTAAPWTLGSAGFALAEDQQFDRIHCITASSGDCVSSDFCFSSRQFWQYQWWVKFSTSLCLQWLQVIVSRFAFVSNASFTFEVRSSIEVPNPVGTSFVRLPQVMHSQPPRGDKVQFVAPQSAQMTV